MIQCQVLDSISPKETLTKHRRGEVCTYELQMYPKNKKKSAMHSLGNRRVPAYHKELTGADVRHNDSQRGISRRLRIYLTIPSRI